ncbi:MAG: dephospho-CoA kinase [bacterium]
MLHVGITGNIGSGKSTVGKYLISKGYFVFDSDEFVSTIYKDKKYSNIKDQIKQLFPECVKNQRLIKKCIKRIIFDDINKKEQLEKILHPVVIDQIIKLKRSISENKSYKKKHAFFIVPLLYEKKLEYLFDEIWVVFAPKNVCIQRIVDRDKIDQNLAEKIMESQMDPLEKVKKADKVIINDKTISELYKQIQNFIK